MVSDLGSPEIKMPRPRSVDGTQGNVSTSLAMFEFLDGVERGEVYHFFFGGEFKRKITINSGFFEQVSWSYIANFNFAKFRFRICPLGVTHHLFFF